MPARLGATLLLVALATGCASGPVLDRAIRARGGPLRSFIRTADAEVEAGFPGTWRWRMTFLAPDRYAWSITTTAGVDHYLFDGTTVRAVVGGRELGADTSPDAPLRMQAAFIAASNLDAVRTGGTATPLPPGALPPGVASGLAVTLPEPGASYRLGFDERLLLVWATGPFDVPQTGRVELTARYGDYRRVRGLWLPFRVTYEIGSRRLAVERALRVCPNPPDLTAAAFVDPERLPACTP